MGAGLLREPILAAQPDGVGTVEGPGRLWAMVRVLPLAPQSLRAGGGGLAASPCWAALPLTQLTAWLPSIWEGTSTQASAHRDQSGQPVPVCEAFGGP